MYINIKLTSMFRNKIECITKKRTKLKNVFNYFIILYIVFIQVMFTVYYNSHVTYARYNVSPYCPLQFISGVSQNKINVIWFCSS